MSDGPGLLSIAGTGNLTILNGSVYNWSVASVITDTPVSTTLGSGTTAKGHTASWISGTGTLNLSNLTAGGWTININALTASFGFNSGAAAGTIYDMQSNTTYSWTIAAFSGGINGFNANEFTINHGNYDSVNLPTIWSVTQVGNNLVLNGEVNPPSGNIGTVTPEPSGLLLAASAGLALGRLVRRYRRPRTRKASPLTSPQDSQSLALGYHLVAPRGL